MNHPSEPTDGQVPPGSTPGAPDLRRAHTQERRRLLLKGVGRGSALLGATVPLKTLAGQRIITFDSTQCTVSGMQSGVHSVTPSNGTCRGYSTSSWGQSVGNLGFTPVKTWPAGVNCNAACNTVFVRCTLQVGTLVKQPATLFQVVNQFPNTDDAHWVCAWLNAMNPVSMNFPYSTTQVLEYYKASNANALAFFKKYTETNA